MVAIVASGTSHSRILGPTLPGSAASTRKRATLAGFLRSRRERLAPKAVGLPAGGRRRTPGLRREEVASLAGVSTAWYTWLEQGRDIRPSVETLEAIAQALRLTNEERLHAFKLAGLALPEAPPAPAVVVAPPSVQAVLDALAFPAYAADRLWNVVAWNPLADTLFEYARRAPTERNSLLIAFGDPVFRARLDNWADEARHLVASARRVFDEATDDPAIASLLDRLRTIPEFHRLWVRHDVQRRPFALKVITHPTLGVLRFEAQSYHSAPFGLSLTIFVPDADTLPKLRRAAMPGRRTPRRAS